MIPRILRSPLLAALGALLPAVASPLRAAEAISFDVINVAATSLSSTTLAGPAGGPRFDHWNRFYGAALTSAADSTGRVLPIGVAITPGTNGGYISTGTIGAATGDVSMTQTYLDLHAAGTLSLTGIPYASYDVYVYVYGDQGTLNDRGGTISNGATTYAIRTGAATRLTTNDGAGYLLSNDTATPPSTTTQLGNHVRFSGLSGSACTLALTAANTLGNATPRLKLAGFQIVNTGAPLVASTAPEPPALDILYPGNNQVIVTWRGSVGAASYTVQRAESESGPWTDLGAAGTTDLPRHTDAGLTNGQTYFYRVVANNAIGSTPGASGSVAPFDPATLRAVGVSFKGNAGTGTPMEASALAGAPGVRVANWNNYELNGSTTLTTLADASGAVVPDLTAGLTLAAGSRILSSAALAATETNDRRLFGYFADQTANNRTDTITATNIPYARYDVYIYMRDDGPGRAGQFTLGSTTYFMRGFGLGDPTNDGVGYRRSLDTTLGSGSDIDQGNYVRFEGVTGSSFTATITPVAAGDGAFRAKVAGFQIVDTTPAGAPPATPAGLVVVSGDAQVALSWNAVLNATGYTVSRGTSHVGPFTELVTQPDTSHIDATAVNGTLYYYIVTANNSAGPGVATTPISARAQSYVSTSLGFNVKGAAVAGMSAADLAGAPSVRLPNWNNLNLPAGAGGGVVPANLVDSGGAAVTGVTLTYTNGTSAANVVTGVPGANDRNLFYSGADIYADSATDVAGNTPATLSVTGIPYATYDLYVYMRDDGADRAAAITANGVTRYLRGGIVEPSSSGAGYVHSDDADPAVIDQANYVRIAGLSGNLTATLAAFDAGAPFARFKLVGFQIVNATASAPVTTAPAAPGGVTVMAGVAQNTIAWSPVATATSYTILRASTPGGAYAELATVSAFVTSYTDTGLTEGVTYYYVVRADNAVGSGAVSGEASGTTLPAAPAALVATGGDTTVTLAWTPAATATGHKIKRSLVAGGPYEVVATAGASGSFTDTGLANGTGYYYVVSTISPVGESSDSAEALGVPVVASVVRSIGINLTNTAANGSLPTDRSGAPGVYRGNWNNLIPADLGVGSVSTNPAVLVGPVAGALVDDTGVTVADLVVEYVGNSGRTTGTGIVTRNAAHPDRLYASVWDQFNTQTSAVTITGIPYELFDLYVYIADDGAARGGYVEDTMTGLLHYIRGGAGEPAAGGVGYVASTDTSLGLGTDIGQGNYIRIPGCVRFDPAGVKGYSINLRAVNTGDGAAQRLKVAGIQLVNTSSLTALPAAADDVIALAGDHQVALSWTAAPGVASYHIGRATTAGGAYATLATGVTGTTYTDATAVNGTTYYYVVTSVGPTAGTHSAEVSATPALADPLAAWRQQYFGTTANTGEAANDADPDADGLANLLEYAFGTHPKEPGAGAGPILGRSGDFLTLSFTHNADVSLSYVVETGNDLAGVWTPAHTYTGYTASGTEVYQDTVPLNSITRRFLRLRVTTP